MRKVKLFRRIASAGQGNRDERSLASYLVRKPKRAGNNFTGQTGLERCSACVKAKKKVRGSSVEAEFSASLFGLMRGVDDASI